MFELILIDFSWLYNKYYFVAKFQAEASNVLKEEETSYIKNKLLSMLKQFLKIVQDNYFASKIILVMDTPTSQLINAPIFEGYKQNRDKDSKKDVYKPLNYIVGELSKSPKLNFIRSKGYEADQVIAFLTEKYCKERTILIYSGDKDLLQLTHYKRVRVSDKFEKGKFLIKSDKDIFEKFKNSKGEDFTRISTDKRDILKYRVLKGDPSDNLSPVFPRIKDKEIVSIIKEYWIDHEELTDVRINDILDDIRGDNPKLAEKLETNMGIWLRNYKLMNIQGLKNIKMCKIKGE